MATTFWRRVDQAITTLTPGYFALVMATGILSVGTHLEGFDVLSTILLAICAIAFITLVTLTIIRAIKHRSALKADFLDPARAFGFFTYVAGTNVLAVRLATAGYAEITITLLTLSLTAWIILGYVVPWTAVLGKTEHPVVKYANGTWFIPVLFCVGWWRHRTHRVPLKYEPTLWSMVFPLGMYAVAGIYLGQANDLPLVGWIGRTELWLAVTAWALVFIAMLRHLTKTLTQSQKAPATA